MFQGRTLNLGLDSIFKCSYGDAILLTWLSSLKKWSAKSVNLHGGAKRPKHLGAGTTPSDWAATGLNPGVSKEWSKHRKAPCT